MLPPISSSHSLQDTKEKRYNLTVEKAGRLHFSQQHQQQQLTDTEKDGTALLQGFLPKIYNLDVIVWGHGLIHAAQAGSKLETVLPLLLT